MAKNDQQMKNSGTASPRFYYFESDSLSIGLHYTDISQWGFLVFVCLFVLSLTFLLKHLSQTCICHTDDHGRLAIKALCCLLLVSYTNILGKVYTQ